MNTLFSNGRSRFFFGLWLVLICMGTGLVFFIVSSPANASLINELGATPTATQENLWAYANGPKPT